MIEFSESFPVRIRSDWGEAQVSRATYVQDTRGVYRKLDSGSQGDNKIVIENYVDGHKTKSVVRVFKNDSGKSADGSDTYIMDGNRHG